MDELQEALTTELLGNALSAWLIALGAAVAITLALLLLRRLLRVRLQELARRTATGVDDLVVDMLGSMPTWFLLLVGLYASSASLDLSSRAEGVLGDVVLIAVLLQVGRCAGRTVLYLVEQQRERLDESRQGTATFSIVRFAGLLGVWSFVTLLALENLGFDVTALLAGLGVGGIAVALAAQSILGDLFASLCIALDKPFAVGDFLIVGDLLGSVESIGIKTTRLRSLSGEQLVLSNTDLLGSRIHNYGRMRERRVAFTVGVTYQTPRDTLERIPDLLREAVESQGPDATRFDRAHFKSYGAYSLDFEIVYYVMGADYNAYMDVQQAINLAIHEAFEDAQVEFAYPTQTLLLSREED